jgi:phospholipid transport system substrate-binding protein
MPHVNFRRMTSLATGPAWRKATAEQQKRLQEEFKILLVRTYAGALSQINDQVVFVKPLRAGQEDKNLVVNTEIRGKSDPIQLDYRLERTPGEGSGWMIFDLNVLGIWLVENYRTQFTKEINSGGIDGLIASLAARNKSNAKAS